MHRLQLHLSSNEQSVVWKIEQEGDQTHTETVKRRSSPTLLVVLASPQQLSYLVSQRSKEREESVSSAIKEYRSFHGQFAYCWVERLFQSSKQKTRVIFPFFKQISPCLLGTINRVICDK